MPISTRVQINIGGEKLYRFSQLVINQKVHSHHSFSLIQPLPKEFISEAMEKTQSYVGKTINITIEASAMLTQEPLEFTGIITEARMIRTAGSAGGIVINGFSPTIMMEGTPHVQSYTDMTLGNVIQQILKKYPSDVLKSELSIQRDTTLPYTVQYGESDFSFMCRMAEKKGQWMYYNGTEFIFGNPKPKTFTLEYGRTLHTFNIEMRAKPLGFEYMGYDASNADTQRVSASEISNQMQGPSQTMIEASKKIFSAQTTMFYNHQLDEGAAKSHLADRVTTQLQSRTSELVNACGDSDETGLRIGDIIVIKEPAFSMTKNIFDIPKEQAFGSYYVTDIIHVCDESGSYHNTFNAIPEGVIAPSYGNVHSCPLADTQSGVVLENIDPSGLGRIKVELFWQKDSGSSTPWIRMVQPHGGSGKGFYFIPEIGEEVLVGFEGGNAEKPFVIGTVYNGKEVSGYADSTNSVKAIHTRSGHILKFTEDESIIITDKSGNIIHLDTTESNINITAPNDITISAGRNVIISAGKSVSVNAGENITSIATNDIIQTASGDIVEKSDNRKEIIQKEYQRQSEVNNTKAQQISIFSTKENMTLQSGKTIENNSSEKTNLF